MVKPRLYYFFTYGQYSAEIQFINKRNDSFKHFDHLHSLPQMKKLLWSGVSYEVSLPVWLYNTV